MHWPNHYKGDAYAMVMASEVAQRHVKCVDSAFVVQGNIRRLKDVFPDIQCK